jgi:hypothetical protein
VFSDRGRVHVGFPFPPPPPSCFSVFGLVFGFGAFFWVRLAAEVRRRIEVGVPGFSVFMAGLFGGNVLISMARRVVLPMM